MLEGRTICFASLQFGGYCGPGDSGTRGLFDDVRLTKSITGASISAGTLLIDPEGNTLDTPDLNLKGKGKIILDWYDRNLHIGKRPGHYYNTSYEEAGFFGSAAANLTGEGNVLIGDRAAQDAKKLRYSFALGQDSMANIFTNTSYMSYNTAIGYGAMSGNVNYTAVYSAQQCTALGRQAMGELMDGVYADNGVNTHNTTSYKNVGHVAVGQDALRCISDSDGCTAVGRMSLGMILCHPDFNQSYTGNQYNVAVGPFSDAYSQAGLASSNVSHGVAIGSFAGLDEKRIQIGDDTEQLYDLGLPGGSISNTYIGGSVIGG